MFVNSEDCPGMKGVKGESYMKFTQGYWMIKQNYIMSYATHAFRVTKKEKALEVISMVRFIT